MELPDDLDADRDEVVSEEMGVDEAEPVLPFMVDEVSGALWRALIM